MNEETEATRIGKALLALRTIVDSECVVCGTPIRGMKRRRYCSSRCKVADWRAKQKQAE